MYPAQIFATANAALVHGHPAKALATLFPVATSAALVIGAYIGGRFLLRVCALLLNTFVWRGTNLDKYGAHKGSWAVVTGASHGIGREFALQLARAGFNVALVSRTASRLAQVAKEIADLPRGSVSTIQHQIDFASAGEAEWAALQETLEALDVGILINNAGLNHTPAVFASVSGAEAGAVVAVNAFAPVRVTSIVLPGMISRHRGLILNIGSIVGGAVPLPYMAVYSGTKAFILSWTQALATELGMAKTGIDVRAVHLGFVADAMADFVTESAAIPSPKRWVQSALARVGLVGGAGRSFVSNPFWAHAFEEFFTVRFGLEDVARRSSFTAFARRAAEETKAK